MLHLKNAMGEMFLGDEFFVVTEKWNLHDPDLNQWRYHSFQCFTFYSMKYQERIKEKSLIKAGRKLKPDLLPRFSAN